MIRDHFSHCGLTGNSFRLTAFRDVVLRSWLGQRHRTGRLSWEIFNAIHFRMRLPDAKAFHSIYTKRVNLACGEPDST